MFRRYNRRHSRFDQPDPYDGSYDLTDPQSFNRYAYVKGDPVNLTDPTGLDPPSGPNLLCLGGNCWYDGVGTVTTIGTIGSGMNGVIGGGLGRVSLEFYRPVEWGDGPVDSGGNGIGEGPGQRNTERPQGPTRAKARELAFRACLDRKRREAEQARRQYNSQFPDRVFRQIKIGAARGSLIGAWTGGSVGAAAGGIGAVPGALGGAALGAMGGAYAGGITGVLLEPAFRVKNDIWDYRPALDRAIIECDIEADRVL